MGNDDEQVPECGRLVEISSEATHEINNCINACFGRIAATHNKLITEHKHSKELAYQVCMEICCALMMNVQHNGREDGALDVDEIVRVISHYISRLELNTIPPPTDTPQ